MEKVKVSMHALPLLTINPFKPKHEGPRVGSKQALNDGAFGVGRAEDLTRKRNVSHHDVLGDKARSGNFCRIGYCNATTAPTAALPGDGRVTPFSLFFCCSCPG